MKTYKLKRDLPWAKAGTEYKLDEFETFEVGINPLAFPDWFEEVDDRWKPKAGDNVWALGNFMNNAFTTTAWVNNGIYFRTQEDAEKAGQAIVKLISDMRERGEIE